MKNRIFKLISILFLLIILFFVYIFLYNNYQLNIPCYFSLVTGLDCPGCGITRMVLSILILDFYQAFRYNPLVFIYMPFIIAYIVYKIYIYIYDKENKIINNIPNKYICIVLIVTILYGILRNIEIFSFLKPTVI